MAEISRPSRIISGTEAVALARGDRHVVFLDVRSTVGSASLRPDYENAHVPGAHYVELGRQLQAPGGGTSGQRPLPEPEALQSDLRRWGIRHDSMVVVYSRNTPAAAARAWFVLEWAGLQDVFYLDGGLDAWVSAGGETTKDEPKEGEGTVTVGKTGGLAALSAADIASDVAAGRAVFDARDSAAYRGDGSPRSGHIPGARSLPSKQLVEANGKLLPKAQVLAILETQGVRPGDTVGLYCGGGVAAALNTLVLQEYGIDGRLFVGSFSAWAADATRDVECGAAP